MCDGGVEKIAKYPQGKTLKLETCKSYRTLRTRHHLVGGWNGRHSACGSALLSFRSTGEIPSAQCRAAVTTAAAQLYPFLLRADANLKTSDRKVHLQGRSFTYIIAHSSVCEWGMLQFRFGHPLDCWQAVRKMGRELRFCLL